MPVQAIRDSGTQHSRSARAPGWSWIPNGAILAAGGASPGLLLAATWQQVSFVRPYAGSRWPNWSTKALTVC